MIIISSDNKELEISDEAAALSEVLETSLVNCEDVEPTPIPKVNEKILKKIVEFCEHYVTEPYDFENIELPIGDSTFDNMPEWYTNYVNNLDLEKEIFDVLTGADYLIIMSLRELCSIKIASEIIGKAPEEIRRIFKVENDFSPEEMEAFSKEHAYINQE